MTPLLSLHFKTFNWEYIFLAEWMVGLKMQVASDSSVIYWDIYGIP